VPKPALTALSASMETVHVATLPAPAQTPPQPVNVLPEAALAVSVTCVPGAYTAEHLLPQLSTRSSEETEPLPEPDTPRLSAFTSRFAAAFCAPMASPSSPGLGAVQVRSAHSASWVSGSYAPAYW